MIINIFHNNQNYRIDTKQFIDISIPYKFNGEQPNYYDVNPGQSTPLKSGETIFSVRSGAGCNVPEISMNIHCTGTHTECVGHLLENPGDIGVVLKDILIPTILITVNPKSFNDTNEYYHCPVKNNEFDHILCIEVLEHLPNPTEAIYEFSRILNVGGTLILTAPFNSLTHYAPFYFYNGFSKYYYSKI